MARPVSRSWGSETPCETGVIAMTDKPISPLRQRMIEDMTARHFAEKAQKDYIQYTVKHKGAVSWARAAGAVPYPSLLWWRLQKALELVLMMFSYRLPLPSMAFQPSHQATPTVPEHSMVSTIPPLREPSLC